MVQGVANALTSKEAKAGAVFALYHTTPFLSLCFFEKKNMAMSGDAEKRGYHVQFFPFWPWITTCCLLCTTSSYMACTLSAWMQCNNHFCHLLVWGCCKFEREPYVTLCIFSSFHHLTHYFQTVKLNSNNLAKSVVDVCSGEEAQWLLWKILDHTIVTKSSPNLCTDIQ